MDATFWVLIMILVVAALAITGYVLDMRADGWKQHLPALKHNLLTALLIFLLLHMFTIIGSSINQRLNYANTGTTNSLGIKLIFVLNYLLSTRIKTKWPIAIRLPVIRTIFWTAFILLDLISKNQNPDGNVFELLNTINGGICSLYTTVLSICFSTYHLQSVLISYLVEAFLLGTLLVAAFEYLVISMANKLSHKFLFTTA